MSKTQKCRRCGVDKPIETFRNKVNAKNRHGVFCADCKEILNEQYRTRYAEGAHKHFREQAEYRRKLFAEPVPVGQVRCRTCLSVKDEAEFACYSPRTPYGRSVRCKACRDKSRQYARQLRFDQSSEEHRRDLARAKELRDGRKKQVIEHYGGQCVCCGEQHIEFLTMDHIVPVGAKGRKERGDWGNRFYLAIIKKDFPDDYRCLCWNCNWSFGCYGYCPHQQARSLNATESNPQTHSAVRCTQSPRS